MSNDSGGRGPEPHWQEEEEQLEGLRAHGRRVIRGRIRAWRNIHPPEHHQEREGANVWRTVDVYMRLYGRRLLRVCSVIEGTMARMESAVF